MPLVEGEKFQTGIHTVDIQKSVQSLFGEHEAFLDETINSGISGRLAEKLRGQEVLPFEKIVPLASDLGARPSILKKVILPKMEGLGFGELVKSGSEVVSFKENCPSPARIMEVVGAGWIESQSKSEVEQAALKTLMKLSNLPEFRSSLEDEVAPEFGKSSFGVALEVGDGGEFIKTYEPEGSDEPMLYSPLYFGENPKRQHGFIKDLRNRGELDDLSQVIEKVQGEQSFPVARLGEKEQSLLQAAHQVGIVDNVEIATSLGRKETFSFTGGVRLKEPPMRDICEEVKLVTSNIQFGKYYSQGARIRDPVVLLRALVDKGTIGPASPIGTDYPLLVKSGVVGIRKAAGDFYYMDLIPDKKEIVESAIELLAYQAPASLRFGTLPSSVTLPGAGFKTPQQVRVEHKKLPEHLEKTRQKLLEKLIGER